MLRMFLQAGSFNASVIIIGMPQHEQSQSESQQPSSCSWSAGGFDTSTKVCLVSSQQASLLSQALEGNVKKSIVRMVKKNFIAANIINHTKGFIKNKSKYQS
ncbi:MAG: hypothetical protein EOO06_16675 [Chitinophagaceae bacterium]|nr:MAG: hypothetical protein EOO06_16675 [Chitinophagaceae bacterium]